MPTAMKAMGFAAALMLGSAATPALAAPGDHPGAQVAISNLPLDADLTLRRMVVRNADARQTVLLVHGFPETLYTWRDISLALGDDFEVHAFDWPGFRQSSRPAVNLFACTPKDYARVLRGRVTVL